jgi:membrane protein YqaA with SNARE-associated domain
MYMDFTFVISQFLSWSYSLAEMFGYLGIFVVSLLGCASILFPIPSVIVIFAFGAILNPWLVGLVAGVGSALGELTAYVVGIGGGKVLERKHKRWLNKAKTWMERHGAFFIVFLFAATPLPHDVVGILCGAIKYDIRKFFFATLIGKTFASLILAWAGFFGIQWVLNVFGL